MRSWALIFFIWWGLAVVGYGQDVFYTKTGKVHFYSQAPFEDIEANSNQMTAFLNKANGELRFRIPISSFEFPNSLMQKHFNTQYMESQTYPYAEFKGNIQDHETVFEQITHAPMSVEVVGELTIRNISKKRTFTAKLQQMEDGYAGSSVFYVPLADHEIKIPKLMFKSIAETIKVDMVIDFLPYTK
ncbi:MAG: YceI family protein [Bernardetiaceae bacterium]